MESRTNYTLVGLIVLILTASLLAAGLWLSVGFDQKKYNTYVVYIHEAVSGLSEESPVKYNGVQVGNVKSIELSRLDPQQVKLILNIEEGTPITTSTYATLISQGITGVTYVGLSASSSDLTLLQKKPQEPYPIIQAKPSLFKQLDSVLKEVSENINSVSIEIKKVFDKENITNLKNILADVHTLTQVIAINKEFINHSIKNANTALKNIAQASKQFPEALHDLQIGAVKVSSTMDEGKLTLEKISQQTVPPIISLIQRLELIAANLEKVSDQMRQNPSVVIRGTTLPKLGPGE